MRKYISVIIGAIIAVLALAGCSMRGGTTAASAGAPVPNSFQVVEQAMSWTTTMDVVAGNMKYGTVKESGLSALGMGGTKLEYSDAAGNLVATGKARLLTWSDTEDVFDAAGNLRSKFVENVWQSWSHVYTDYTIYDGQGNKIAYSQKVQGWDTNFSLYDASGNEIARLHRPTFNIGGDVWQVDVLRPGVVPTTDLVMIAGFKTAADNHSNH